MKPLLAGLLFGLFAAFTCRGDLHLPEPPQQHKLWHSETAIPTNLLSVTETLFDQGFPDPRGCEYREVEVDVSGVWNDKRAVVKTHGWVLPARSRSTNRFAICWNGLVYPVVSVGAPAELHAEVFNQFKPVSLTLTNHLHGTNQIITREFMPRMGWRNNLAAGENATVFFTNAFSTRVELLLRCGEVEAALKSWTPNQRMMYGGGGRPPPNNDAYLELASDWAWAMFDRTICAHMRGDEALALATARQLAEVRPKFEAECARRGFPQQQYYEYPRRNEKKPYLDFLEQLPPLLTDLERREKEGPHVSVIKSGLERFTNQTERIAALIHDLDLVQARQWGQPGGVNLPEDQVVAALIQEDDAAVRPLMDCLENDKRLTRSVSFGRDFIRGRTVIPVNQAASAAIHTILHAGFSGNISEIRAYWNRYGSLKLEDRWYAILNEDTASNRWLEAAGNIVQRENATRYPHGLSITKPAPTIAPVRMQGEVLRNKSNPSISELMARRALEVPKENPNTYELSAAAQMGLHLAAWDSRAGGPVLKTLSKRCRTVMQYSGQQLGGLLTKLSLARAAAEDADAFEDYAEWLPSTSPEQMGFSISEILEPLQIYPVSAALQSAADKIFSNTNSGWSHLPWPHSGADNPAASGLVNVPAFRRLLIRELDRKEVCGSITWQAPDMVNYAISNYMSGGFSYSFSETAQTTNGTIADLRWCDWIATSLANGKHISSFNPFDPVEKRDEAIALAKQSLFK